MKGHNILAALRSQLSAWTGRHRTGLITGVTCVLSISIVLLTALSAFHQREQATLEMEAALGGKRDIESLQALLVDANTEFLRGLGGASTASHAWPVSRTAGVARLYTELESDPRIEPRDIALIRDLRQLTANWTLQLESATSRTIPTGTSVAVDSALLLAANETLRGMTARLSTLRAHEDARVAAMSVESQRRLIRERFALVLAAVCAGVFLAYGFIANHRVSLARARNRIIAHEAEKRFDDYFDHHPLAMLIFDVHSLQILATNTAAQRQYGYSQQRFVELRVSSLVADGSLAPFLSDTGRLDVAENRSGTAGVRTHRRADQTLIHAEVSYHFLRYASRDACFVVAIEVTEHEKAKLALRLRGRALDATLNAVLITRPSTHGDLVDYVNPAFERVTGYAREDVLNRDCAFMLCVDGERDSIATIREMFRSNRERTMLIFNQRRDGTRYWSQMHIAPVLDE